VAVTDGDDDDDDDIVFVRDVFSPGTDHFIHKEET